MFDDQEINVNTNTEPTSSDESNLTLDERLLLMEGRLFLQLCKLDKYKDPIDAAVVGCKMFRKNFKERGAD